MVSKENNIAKRLNNLNQTIETDSAKLLEKVESKDNNNKMKNSKHIVAGKKLWMILMKTFRR